MLEQVEPSGQSSTRRLYLLDEAQIIFYWSDLCEGLKTVPGFYDYYDNEWVWEQIKTGHLLVWALSDGEIRGIVITRILIYPKQKVFDVVAIFGQDMLIYFHEMEDVFNRIAKRFGCHTISALCRPGVARKLRPFRAETVAYVLRREVPQLTGDH